MSAASPTPMAGSHYSLGRRTSARQALRRPTSRPHLGRSESNPVHRVSSGGGADPDQKSASQPQQYSTLNDSSDDEIPVPMKLSALTKALLNDGGASASSGDPSAGRQQAPEQPAQAPAVMTRRRSVLNRSTSSAGGDAPPERPASRQTRRHARSGSGQMSSSKPASPIRSHDSSPAPRKRVVRLSTTPAGGIQNQIPPRRSLSSSRPARRPPSRDRAGEERSQLESQQQQQQQQQPNVNTPASARRRVQIAVGSSGSKARLSGSSGFSSKRSGSAPQSDHEQPEDPATVGRPQGSVSRFSASVRGKESDPALQSSMRIKRIGKVPGSFLSGPARRGRRRQSEEEEENSPVDENGEPLPGSQPNDADGAASSFYASYARDYAASGSPVSAKDPGRASLRHQVSATAAATRESPPPGSRSGDEIEIPHYRIRAARPQMPSSHDQENEGPASIKRSSVLADKDSDKKPLRPLSVDIGSSAAAKQAPPPAAAIITASPERKALATLSKNTPRRPAPPPPPPKMSVLDTATATAGAATTAQAGKKQRILLKVNGRSYQRVDCIGRGGSAKVYKVTAENGRMFALKRVSIEHADETTIRGYLGEIDLLKKLSGVDRVIQLFDCEMNKEKHMLSLLMEMGELDFNRLVRAHQNPEASKLDPVFVRFYWKEMLECLQAVHANDIVHSDLKPANFVLVQGRLKLIDFGIANAIQTDETVNVHRETQVGTPNYMSPESLMDSHQYAFTAGSGGAAAMPYSSHGKTGMPKVMKLGKPSDVWSLGCILYQMVYGSPPFGHIQNQMARCHAIINWHHAVDFPERGLGGVAVPASLLRTMRRCLQREQERRPTCAELLSAADPFLYPVEVDVAGAGAGAGGPLPVSEELLGRIIQSVVARCRERMPTESEALGAWPGAYWASVRKAVGGGAGGAAAAPAGR